MLKLRAMLNDPRSAPSGAVLSANKRDMPTAIPLDELRAWLEEAGWPIGVVQSVAADDPALPLSVEAEADSLDPPSR